MKKNVVIIAAGAILILALLFIYKATVSMIRTYEKMIVVSDSIYLTSCEIILKEIKTEKKIIVNICSDDLHIIHIWATWCKPCVEEMRYILQFVENTDEESNLFIISFESQEKVHRFISEKKWTGPFYICEDELSVFSKKISILPTSVFIKAGKILAIKTGRQDWPNLSLENLEDVKR